MDADLAFHPWAEVLPDKNGELTMSFRPMVKVGNEWAGNAVRFATREEAEASARDLYGRWTLCVDHRADESEDAVNCEWDAVRGNVHLEVVNA